MYKNALFLLKNCKNRLLLSAAGGFAPRPPPLPHWEFLATPLAYLH